MFIRPSDNRFAKGGIIRDNRRIDKDMNPISINGVPVEDVPEGEVKVYKSYQKPELGPIGKLHPDTSVYDFIFSDSPDILKCKALFEDWTFPEIKTTPMDDYGQPEKRILPIRNLTRGAVNSTNFFIEQYLYAIINHDLFPISDFGSGQGMRADRSSVLVCVRACDPRYGILSEATVQYAVPLSTRIHDCISLAGCEIVDGEKLHYYTLNGDFNLGQRVSDDWFSTTTYKFNGVIYPMVRMYTDYQLDTQVFTPEQQLGSEIIQDD